MTFMFPIIKMLVIATKIPKLNLNSSYGSEVNQPFNQIMWPEQTEEHRVKTILYLNPQKTVVSSPISPGECLYVCLSVYYQELTRSNTQSWPFTSPRVKISTVQTTKQEEVKILFVKLFNSFLRSKC